MAAQNGQFYRKYNFKFTSAVTMTTIARRGSGKSVLFQNVLYDNRKFFSEVWVFAGSEAVYNDWKNRVPPSHIMMYYSPERMAYISERARRMNEFVGKNHLPKYQICVIGDDIAYDKSTFKCKHLLKAYMNGRHRDLSVLLAVQYLMSIPPTIRTQSDIVVVLRETNITIIHKLYDYWFSVVPKKADFVSLMKKATCEFGALVVNNRTPLNEPTECVFTYKARPECSTLEWTLCIPRVWKIDRATALLKAIQEARQIKREKEIVQEGGLHMPD
jgi:hypothetical protein